MLEIHLAEQIFGSGKQCSLVTASGWEESGRVPQKMKNGDLQKESSKSMKGTKRFLIQSKIATEPIHIFRTGTLGY